MLQTLKYEQVTMHQQEMRKEARERRMITASRPSSRRPVQGTMRTVRLSGRLLTYRTA